MPYAALRHCPRGHRPYAGERCPICEAARKAEVDGRRPSAVIRGYGSAWNEARKEYLAANAWCACGKAAKVVDHVTPHEGDLRLFWDRRNWQPLCRSCHSRKTASTDGGFGNRRA